jgi:hypothetical protein
MNKTQPTESKPNRQYKASVFSKLFGDEATALEVYNAIAAHPFPPVNTIKLNIV